MQSDPQQTTVSKYFDSIHPRNEFRHETAGVKFEGEIKVQRWIDWERRLSDHDATLHWTSTQLILRSREDDISWKIPFNDIRTAEASKALTLKLRSMTDLQHSQQTYKDPDFWVVILPVSNPRSVTSM